MSVQIIQGKPSFTQRLNAAVGKGVDFAAEHYREKEENESIKNKYGVDLSGIKDPTTRQQILADELRFGRKKRQAEATQGMFGEDEENGQIPFEQPIEKPTERASNRSSSQKRENLLDEQQISKRELPEFAGKSLPKQTNRSEIQTGNAPQPESEGVKRPILTPEQIISKGKKIAQQQTAQGNPTTELEGIQLAGTENQLNADYNKSVEADVAQRVGSQLTYGKLAQEKLEAVMKNPTDEQKAIFQKKGEEASKKYKSEAEINKYLAKEAVKFKDTIAKAEKSIPAPRLMQNIKENVLGVDRKWEQRRDDIRAKLKPLLDEGLYDTSRDILSKLGYHPEEREGIITDLGEKAKRELINFPQIKKSDVGLKRGYQGMLTEDEYYTPEDLEKTKDGIKNVLKSDPSSNLILLRKGFEEKGVDWRAFKDQLNDLIFSGDVVLDDDQFKHLDLLDNPPLDNLDKILFGLKLIGR